MTDTDSGSVRTPLNLEESAESNTRSRVLNTVLEHGPVSARDLGRLLDLTPAAIRRHLDALERDRFIEVTMVRRHGAGAGRPARRYVVAPEGHERIGNDYLGIAADALGAIRDLGGETALREFVAAQFQRMERRYRPTVEAAGDDVAERLDVLAQLLSADGYAASATIVKVGPARHKVLSAQLCQGHCPLQEIATRHPEFCDAETRMISSLLDVDIRRLSTLAAGAHVCNTHVPLSRPAAGQKTNRPTTV
ncbi:MarR family transcriptional regulator [Kocuria sp. JC486]|uniref:Winged helix-turn-helix transcriptional regulator n=1 Tax=Kocuria soli TaxID=2485125 RepID=A0A3N4A590_9MICC|nr:MULTISPECIES: helix-turn-helix domain-containing protein [Kocuria]NHU84024.1 MarR family transcriptional regulator [Kocuria sp. JC486]ROZ63800.1 winged helix-turn-helix transcriptional regulator [Kocuria soli]